MAPRLSSLLLVILLAAAPLAAHAQSAGALPTTTLLRTHAGQGAPETTARGFDRVLRQRLDELGVVSISGSVELDLEAVQLALGCMGESVECLRAAAEQAGSDILVFGSVESVDGAMVVSVLRFDASSGVLRRALRTVSSEAAVLEAATPIVRELWELPPVETVEPPPPVEAPPPPSRSLSPWPLVVAAIGGVALVGGAVVMILGSVTRDAYAASRPTTPSEVDATLSLLSTAEDEQRVGVALLAAGAAVAIAGTVWALTAGREDGGSPLALAPWLGEGQLGLVLAGTLPGGGS